LYTQHSLVTQDQTFTHSTTPSRLIFPRSFLWDDGFHMMVLVKNYKHLALRFLNQWMDKIDIFGWIAR
jgi:mannosyl-oligosaccharide glucosidase